MIFWVARVKVIHGEYLMGPNIYDLGYENPSQELDNFLDASGKAAFYFLRRN